MIQGFKAGFRVFAILGDENGLVDKKNPWGAIFEVEQPRFKVTHVQGKFVDVNEALEVARFDIQYCDWRARQDLLTIMLLHEKVYTIIFIFDIIYYCAVSSKYLGIMF